MLDIIKLRCKKCEHSWRPRIESNPLVCPKCKSYDWNVDDKKVEKDEK